MHCIQFGHAVGASKLLVMMSTAQVDVHTNLGDLWRAQGPSGQAEAQRCYAEALRVDVRHAPAWRGLGDLMRERGEHTPAVACYQASSWADGSVHAEMWQATRSFYAVLGVCLQACKGSAVQCRQSQTGCASRPGLLPA